MSAMFDLVPHTRITATTGDYVQPLDSIVDLSEFTDLAVMLNLSEFVPDSTNTLRILLQTAMENRDDRYLTFFELHSINAVDSDFKKIAYLTGEGQADDSNPSSPNTTPMGFGRFVRVITSGITGAMELDFDIKALARSR